MYIYMYIYICIYIYTYIYVCVYIQIKIERDRLVLSSVPNSLVCFRERDLLLQSSPLKITL